MPAVLVAGLVLGAVLEGAALADGILVPISRRRASPLVPPAIRYHKVKVDINGRFATTHVDQVF
ncbi:unnamed protein product, partial [marine sediment metagenome]